MSLDQYLPVILFILVGIAVGVAPQLLGLVLITKYAQERGSKEGH